MKCENGIASGTPQHYRPPSCDKLTPRLKECFNPYCNKSQPGIYHNPYSQSGYCYVECQCGVRGYWANSDAQAAIHWNSIPRRSEVAELLRLVDASIIGTPTPAEERLLQYADKLRKEWKL